MRIRLRGGEKPPLDKDTALTESMDLDEPAGQPQGLSHRQFLKMCGLGVLGAGAGLAAEMVVHPTPASAYTYNEDLHVLGKLGVGTTSPARLVDVYENGTSVAPQLRIQNAGTGDAALGFSVSGATAFVLGIDNSDGDKFKLGNTSGDVGAGTNYLTIDTTGRMGVGTTSPFTKLDVEGKVSVGTGTAQNAFLSADTQLQVLTDSGTGGVLTFWQSGVAGAYLGNKGEDSNFYITNSWDGSAIGTPSKSITLDMNGRLGVGTASPAGKLDVAGDIRINGGIAIGSDGVAKQCYYAP